MTGKEVVDIISALATAFISVIAAYGALRASAKVTELKATSQRDTARQNEKLDHIHEAANGNQLRLQEHLAAANEKIERLYAVVAAVAPNTRAVEQAAAAVPKLTEAVSPPIPAHETPPRQSEK